MNTVNKARKALLEAFGPGLGLEFSRGEDGLLFWRFTGPQAEAMINPEIRDHFPDEPFDADLVVSWAYAKLGIYYAEYNAWLDSLADMEAERAGTALYCDPYLEAA